MNDKFLQFLGLAKRAGRLIEGYNKCEETVKYKKLHLLIMSKEASQNTKDRFLRISERYNIPIIEGYSKEELGYALGREEINVLALTDLKMSHKLQELWLEKSKN